MKMKFYLNALKQKGLISDGGNGSGGGDQGGGGKEGGGDDT